MTRTLILLAAQGAASTTTALAGTPESRGEVAFENRVFDDDDVAATEDAGIGMLGRVEWRHPHAPLDEKVRVYGRLDALDDQRSILVVEEAWIQARVGSLRLRVGADIVNWTATEAFHPADVLNARNLDSDVENFEKLGEPMVMIQAGLFEGTTVQAFYMPVFMRTVFPSPASRLSFAPPGVDLGERRRLVDREGRFTNDDFGHQGAVRIQQTLGSADLSVHALEQMDRLQPVVAVDVDDGLPVAVFQTVRQLGGTYQHAIGGGLLLKLEASYRWFVDASPAPDLLFPSPNGPVPDLPDRDHGTVAVGLEYGVAHDGGSESTLLAEGQAVLFTDEDSRAALNPFQRDVLVGYRFALNDEDGKELLLSTIIDQERVGEFLVNASYGQRLGETWTVRLGVRVYEADADHPTGGFAQLDRADHVRFTLVRHF